MDMTTPTDTVQRLGNAKYVLLTTFRRDGSPVGTPVWVVRDGDKLLVWTPANTHKVARIRRNSSVTLAPCTFSGTVLGETVPGQATVLDAAGAARVRKLIRRKYLVTGFLTVSLSLLRGGRARTIAISIAV
jgi:PPOX class probable F420-dependent enzyme